MFEMEVSSSTARYPVRIESGILGRALLPAKVAIVDEKLASRMPEYSHCKVVAVPGNESTKTLAGCERILVALREAGVRRGDELCAIGGGAVQDAATFVASFYMRGLPWTYCPTTAMSMLDSCIGGKSSINVAGVKNLGGNIYPPSSIAIDPVLARTLTDEAKASGLAEAVKICFAAGPDTFAGFLRHAMSTPDFGSDERTDALIARVLGAKAWFVEIDEFDKKERQLLNFGHTFAHALEAATDYSVPHGIAVAMGVLAACGHPLSASTEDTHRLQTYCRALLAPLVHSVRQQVTNLDWASFNAAVSADKKGTHESIRLVLPALEAPLTIMPVPRSDSSLAAIRDAMASVIGEFG